MDVKISIISHAQNTCDPVPKLLGGHAQSAVDGSHADARLLPFS